MLPILGRTQSVVLGHECPSEYFVACQRDRANPFQPRLIKAACNAHEDFSEVLSIRLQTLVVGGANSSGTENELKLRSGVTNSGE